MTLPKTIRLLSDTIAGILQDPIKDQQARVWSQKVLIPTYSTGEKEKNPMFLEKRVYQGSSGVVYPYPVIEKISDVKTNQEWNALFLENPYLLIMILPELGGRIQMAYDKLKNSHGGLLHVANHHVDLGKKQWTWGNGDFGKAWDRNLTDEDGPYIELMCGVYTDNQPDFSWLMPGEGTPQP